ncbi:hypothetical protein AX768_30175 (plasmid) [Burkholderia sp. PAMC 28687]|nr:hypothetical protein AX768_30175 [Burkholderia sp. PAMC 28687]
MKVRASKKTRFDVARLRTAFDQASSFQIVEATIKRSHGKHCATGKQLTARIDRCIGFGCVDGAGEGGEHRAGALGELFGSSRSKGRTKNDPRQVD